MVKKLGFGLMRLPVKEEGKPAKYDIEQIKEMVDIFMDRGFTYFDTAWVQNQVSLPLLSPINTFYTIIYT